jgi:hypothetical protein
MEKAFWQSIADAEYALPTGHDRLVLTAELVEYLGSPDPELRDTFAYEILGTWVEDGGYLPDQLRDLAATMAANLQAGLGEQAPTPSSVAPSPPSSWATSSVRIIAYSRF